MIKFLLIIKYNLKFVCKQIMHPEKEGEGFSQGSIVDFVEGIDELDDFSNPRIKEVVRKRVVDLSEEILRDWQRTQKLIGKIAPITSMELVPFLYKVKLISDSDLINCLKKGSDRLGPNFTFEELDRINWKFEEDK